MLSIKPVAVKTAIVQQKVNKATIKTEHSISQLSEIKVLSFLITLAKLLQRRHYELQITNYELRITPNEY